MIYCLSHSVKKKSENSKIALNIEKNYYVLSRWKSELS